MTAKKATTKAQVALLGTWQGKDDWREEVQHLVRHLLESVNLGITFVEPTPTSKVPFFPHGAGHIVIEDLVFAQQVMLAYRSDLVVVVDDGRQVENREFLWDRIHDICGCMLMWIPDPQVRKDDLPDQSGCQPGVVIAGGGSITDLAAMIVFLLLKSELDLTSL